MTIYPAQIDNGITLPLAVDGATTINAAFMNAMRSSILGVETALGLNPAGLYGTTAERLTAIELIVMGGSGGFTAGGDLSGSYTLQTVIGIQGNSVQSGLLGLSQDGYVLTWKNSTSRWEPEQITSGSVTLGGDVTGPVNANTLSKINGTIVSSSSPTQSSVLVYDVSGTKYNVRQLTLDDIGAGFSINSFTGGSTVEIGATVVNPAFTSSYSHIPTSAQITNTDSIDSPLVLLSPFTSGTVVGSFVHNAQASTTFTLTAIYTSTKTATAVINFYPRSFGGVGSAGATSTVTASGNNAVLSTGNTINSEGLFSTPVGQTWTFSPSAQKIYILTIGGSRVFKDTSNNTTFVFNTPTSVSFTNQNSQVVSMYLYESTNTLTGTFNINVSS